MIESDFLDQEPSHETHRVKFSWESVRERRAAGESDGVKHLITVRSQYKPPMITTSPVLLTSHAMLLSNFGTKYSINDSKTHDHVCSSLQSIRNEVTVGSQSYTRDEKVID
ncbi:hypothetical protein MJO28_000252 [Puccinia striiformis f. sp. tritici]|uniref:Uncharacterized protein n=1 Tax=Puccinia striiformis f. sp. tritici TaxID=168172 RepID=A0ACC0EWW9_9BASI|nr:hypothetical protein MJO28_000252 [Puccinia striiformis f. sp. tritici]KAI7967701.1 hypothetical protein MJO29_000978 [Puccinia striiformis f. sp. tritici]